MSTPWLKDGEWSCLDNQTVLREAAIAAMCFQHGRLELFLAGHAPEPLLATGESASRWWEAYAGGDPASTGWLRLGDLAVNIAHLLAVQRRGSQIRLILNSQAAIPDQRFVLADSDLTRQLWRDFFMAGNKSLL